jgi:hypothetical protein
MPMPALVSLMPMPSYGFDKGWHLAPLVQLSEQYSAGLATFKTTNIY